MNAQVMWGKGKTGLWRDNGEGGEGAWGGGGGGSEGVGCQQKQNVPRLWRPGLWLGDRLACLCVVDWRFGVHTAAGFQGLFLRLFSADPTR